MKKRLRLAKKNRNIVIDGKPHNPTALADKDIQNAIALIRKNNKYVFIVDMMREGIKSVDIAKHFVSNGYTPLSEIVFLKALRVFRQHCQNIIWDIGKTEAEKTLDELINSDRPNVDIMSELSRLYRLQKERIAIDFKHEKQMDKLFNTTAKEIEIASNILEKMADIVEQDNKDDPLSDNTNTAEVRDKLKDIHVDEVDRQRLLSLTGNFIDKLADANGKVKTN